MTSGGMPAAAGLVDGKMTVIGASSGKNRQSDLPAVCPLQQIFRIHGSSPKLFIK